VNDCLNLASHLKLYNRFRRTASKAQISAFYDASVPFLKLERSIPHSWRKKVV